MEAPPLGPSGEDITWPDQVAPRGRKASSTRKIKHQTSNLISGHVAHAGNHRQGTAGHSQGWCSTQKAVVWGKQMASAREWWSRGATGPVLRCNAGQL